MGEAGKGEGNREDRNIFWGRSGVYVEEEKHKKLIFL
jgi:hypothetical protein